MTTRRPAVIYGGVVSQEIQSVDSGIKPLISVAIVDDDEIVRVGLRLILSRAADIDVVAEATDGGESVELAATMDPDVILMDIRMDDMDGIEATRRIVAGPARSKVVILTTFDIREHVYEALRAGASGFLLKRTAPDQLLHAVRSAAAGDALLSPSITRMMLDEFTAPPDLSSSELDRLTPREREVLVEIALGYSNTEIAERLFVAESTVKTHVKRLLVKLDLRDRIHAVLFAYDHSLVRPGEPNAENTE